MSTERVVTPLPENHGKIGLGTQLRNIALTIFTTSHPWGIDHLGIPIYYPKDYHPEDPGMDAFTQPVEQAEQPAIIANRRPRQRRGMLSLPRLAGAAAIATAVAFLPGIMNSKAESPAAAEPAPTPIPATVTAIRTPEPTYTVNPQSAGGSVPAEASATATPPPPEPTKPVEKEPGSKFLPEQFYNSGYPVTRKSANGQIIGIDWNVPPGTPFSSFTSGEFRVGRSNDSAQKITGLYVHLGDQASTVVNITWEGETINVNNTKTRKVNPGEQLGTVASGGRISVDFYAKNPITGQSLTLEQLRTLYKLYFLNLISKPIQSIDTDSSNTNSVQPTPDITSQPTTEVNVTKTFLP